LVHIAQVVRSLLALGANAMASDTDHFTPLFFAIWHNCLGAARLLANVSDLRYAIKGFTALHTAVMNEICPSLEMLELLLEYDVIRNEQLNHIDATYKTETPLQMAVWLGRYTFAKLLLQHGADPNFCIDGSNCAMHMPANLWFGRKQDQIVTVTLNNAQFRGQIHKLRWEQIDVDGKPMWLDHASNTTHDSPPAGVLPAPSLPGPDEPCSVDHHVLQALPSLRRRFEHRIDSERHEYWHDRLLGTRSHEPPPPSSEIASAYQYHVPIRIIDACNIMTPKHIPAPPDAPTHRTRMMYLLLMYRGDPNARTSDNLFPLYLAAQYNLAALAKLLVSFGAKSSLKFVPRNAPLGMRPASAKTLAQRLGYRQVVQAMQQHKRVQYLPTGNEGIRRGIRHRRARCTTCRKRLGALTKRVCCTQQRESTV
jgi:hypothetical protein